MLLPDAFLPKPKEDCITSGPSVNCMDLLLGSSNEERIDFLRKGFSLARKRSHVFAEFPVEALIQTCISAHPNSKARVMHKPIGAEGTAEYSHAELMIAELNGPAGLNLRERLIEKAIGIYPAKPE
jgi:hypothetical protein